ncbi:MAG: hypothetical protein K6U00_14960 [Armatimonadetes bacterium]|nr:hypothetical protein [Armatimonadota bacterium]
MVRSRTMILAAALTSGLVALWLSWPYMYLFFGLMFAGDYHARLANGYEVVTTAGSKTMGIRRNDHPVIWPTIDGYLIHKGIVLGHVRRLDSMSVPGYFVLDTSTGRKWDGLNTAEWRGVLRRYGITSIPPLLTPGKCSVEDLHLYHTGRTSGQ